MSQQSIRTAFDKDLADIRDMLLRMGALLDRASVSAVLLP